MVEAARNQFALCLPTLRKIVTEAVAGNVRISIIEPGGTKRPLMEFDTREADKVAGDISATVTEILNRRRVQ